MIYQWLLNNSCHLYTEVLPREKCSSCRTGWVSVFIGNIQTSKCASNLRAAYHIAWSDRLTLVFPPAGRLCLVSWPPLAELFPFLPDEAAAARVFQRSRLLTFTALCWDTLALCPASSSSSSSCPTCSKLSLPKEPQQCFTQQRCKLS